MKKKYPKKTLAQKQEEIKDYQREIVEQIIQDLKAGVPTWVKPWSTVGLAMLPTNLSTGAKYTGGNIIILWIRALAQGFTTQHWLGFHQARKLGGWVKKGEKSTCIFRWYERKYTTTELDETSGEEQEEEYSFLACKSLRVFNVTQCEGIDLPPAPELNQDDRNQAVEEFIVRTGADIRHGDAKACFIPKTGRVHMPLASSFQSIDDYYCTLFHELVHWTSPRVKRSTACYATEELVAELGASFLCAEFGITGQLQHAEYLDHWVKQLGEEPHVLFGSASAGAKAVELLHTRL